MAAAKKLVKDIMTKGAKLVTIGPKEKVGDAMALMVAKKVSGLPVVDAGKVVGVITEADVLTAAKSKTVKSVMAAEPITVCPMATIKDAAACLVEKKIKRAIVLDKDGGLAGVVSRTDVIKALLE
jgi:CBS domain-containing protein